MTPLESRVSREKLKSLVDDLSDYVDPVASALADVPVDDEPVTDDDLSAIDESDADIAAGRVVSMQQLRREYGA